MSVIEIKIPNLGESVSEGVIASWLKEDGDAVSVGENIMELETDKAVMEIPAESAGQLQIVAQEGETVEVGQVIAKIDPDADASSTSENNADKTESGSESKNGDKGDSEGSASSKSEKSEKATAEAGNESNGAAESGTLSPAVRKLVSEENLNPADIKGTGKDGRLTKADVLQYLESRTATATKTDEKEEKQAEKPQPASKSSTMSFEGETERKPMSNIRQRIAERLVEAQNNAAILTTFNDIDMSAIMSLRKKYKEKFIEKHGVKLGFMSLFSKAVVQALEKIPELNAHIDGTDMVYHKHVHLGMAVSTERGLMVPVVKYADKKTLAELEHAIGDLAERGRDGKIKPDELSGGTFSITNGGVFGSMLSTPILNPPQSGILGMHRIEDRPVAIDGQVEIRPMMYVALSYDHRIVDGKEAVTFLVRVKECLEDPERMLLDV